MIANHKLEILWFDFLSVKINGENMADGFEQL